MNHNETTDDEIDCKGLLVNFTGFDASKGWEGIPEAILYNAVCGISCLLCLALIRYFYFRKKNQGMSEWNKGWIEFIFSDREADLLHDSNMINPLHPNAYLPQCLHEYDDLIENRYVASTTIGSLYVTNKTIEKRKAEHQAKLNEVGTKRHWLWDYILIKDKDIYDHRGRDAFNYLLFQRYIIYFLILLTFICMALIPINIYGDAGLPGYFEMTTINNVARGSKLLWIHLMSVVVIIVAGLYTMKSFTDVIFLPRFDSDERTILIQNIPRKMRDALKLRQFIQDHFFDIEVTGITFTYDVRELKRLLMELLSIKSALEYCRNYQLENDVPLMINVSMCKLWPSALLCGICYYENQLIDCEELIKKEVEFVLMRPKHAVFVQFKSDLMAQRLLDHLDHNRHHRTMNRMFDYVKKFLWMEDDDPFGYNKWKTYKAPIPEDVEWDDVITSNRVLYSIFLNLLIVVIFIFLTTPIVALNMIGELSLLIGIDKPIKDVIIGNIKIPWTRYYSAMIMNGFACVLPNIITIIELYVPQISTSEKNSKIMIIVYVYMILMIVIFPSLGIMSAQLLIKKMFEKQLPRNFLKCLFQASTSQFYVYYVLSCIFINNAAQLLRLPELGQYLWNCCIYPKTEAEYERARKETNFQFSYGSNYPRFLLVFTIVTTFCVACPILAPLGLLYMFLKHLVDRYSIYYLYSTHVINLNIHQNAIIFVLVSFVFLLFQLSITLWQHSGKDSSLISLKPFNVCIILSIIYTCFLIYTCLNFDNHYRKEHLRILKIKLRLTRTINNHNNNNNTTHANNNYTHNTHTNNNQNETNEQSNINNNNNGDCSATIIHNNNHNPNNKTRWKNHSRESKIKKYAKIK